MPKRILGEHFKRNGQPKRSFTEVEAHDMAKLKHQDYYKCEFCGHWHLASRVNKGVRK